MVDHLLRPLIGLATQSEPRHSDVQVGLSVPDIYPFVSLLKVDLDGFADDLGSCYSVGVEDGDIGVSGGDVRESRELKDIGGSGGGSHFEGWQEVRIDRSKSERRGSNETSCGTSYVSRWKASERLYGEEGRGESVFPEVESEVRWGFKEWLLGSYNRVSLCKYRQTAGTFEYARSRSRLISLVAKTRSIT